MANAACPSGLARLRCWVNNCMTTAVDDKDNTSPSTKATAGALPNARASVPNTKAHSSTCADPATKTQRRKAHMRGTESSSPIKTSKR